MSSPKRIKLALSASLCKCSNYRCPSIQSKTNQQPNITKHNCYQHTLQCPTCNEVWIICLPCKKRFSSNHVQKSRQHFSTMHHTILREDNISSSYISSGISTSALDFDFGQNNSEVLNTNNVSTSIVFGPTMPPSIKENAFNGPIATYLNDSIHSSSKALSGVVARAFAQTHHVRECQPTADESNFHMKVTAFLSKLSGSMHSDFIDILNGAKASNQFKVTRLPLSSIEVGKFYLKENIL